MSGLALSTRLEPRRPSTGRSEPMHDLTVYTELEPLGMGGFADVVRALHIVTKEVVALKKSRPEADCIARTKREIDMQRRLLHGNIMPVLDWAEDGSWFVMPVARGDLLAVHELEPVKDAGLLRLVEDVGAALAAAHRRGFVHRDLTPANILWLRDRWVVADWGFVGLPPGEPRTKLTRTGVGTVGYTAPEVYKSGDAATPAGDIYSLGRVVGWVLVGPTEPGKPIPIEPSSPWARFVAETTRDDPAERPQSVDDALKLLKPAFEKFSDSRPAIPTTSATTFDVEAAAVNAFKVLLQDPSRAIQLDELVDRETEACFAKLTPEAFPVQRLEEGSQLEARLTRYVQVCSLLMRLLVIGCAYGAESQARTWTGIMRRIGRPSGEWGGSVAMLELRRIPAALMMYSGGLAAIARENWVNLASLATVPQLPTRIGEEEAAAALIAVASMAMRHEHALTLPGREQRRTPVSDWLFDQLKEPLRPLLRHDEDYEQAFDRFEYLIAMVVSVQRQGGWVPPGRFAWRSAKRLRFNQSTIGSALRSELETLGPRWGPVQAGMFRDSTQAMSALEAVERMISSSNWF